MKQNKIVFFCVGTGGHVLPVINLIDDLLQRGIEKRKIEVVTDKRGYQYFKDKDSFENLFKDTLNECLDINKINNFKDWRDNIRKIVSKLK